MLVNQSADLLLSFHHEDRQTPAIVKRHGWILTMCVRFDNRGWMMDLKDSSGTHIPSAHNACKFPCVFDCHGLLRSRPRINTNPHRYDHVDVRYRPPLSCSCIGLVMRTECLEVKPSVQAWVIILKEAWAQSRSWYKCREWLWDIYWRCFDIVLLASKNESSELEAKVSYDPRSDYIMSIDFLKFKM